MCDLQGTKPGAYKVAHKHVLAEWGIAICQLSSLHEENELLTNSY